MISRGIIAVTGANRGIGATIAIELARRGFMVGALSRSGEYPASIDPKLTDRIILGKCDVTDESEVRSALAKLLEHGSQLSGIVNNAGIHLDGPSDRFATADFEKIMGTNATAVFVVAREAFPHLVAAGGGVIVNLGSFFDKLGVRGNVAYCASKAAVGAITRCLAVEWASKGIRVIDVAPGYVVTDLNRSDLAAGQPLAAYLERRIPAGKPSTPEPIARLVASLFSEDIPFLTGETIYVDGGQAIAH